MLARQRCVRCGDERTRGVVRFDFREIYYSVPPIDVNVPRFDAPPKVELVVRVADDRGGGGRRRRSRGHSHGGSEDQQQERHEVQSSRQNAGTKVIAGL